MLCAMRERGTTLRLVPHAVKRQHHIESLINKALDGR